MTKHKLDSNDAAAIGMISNYISMRIMYFGTIAHFLGDCNGNKDALWFVSKSMADQAADISEELSELAEMVDR